MLRVSRQRVHVLASTADFPAPVVVLAAGSIWERAAVEEWMRSTGRDVVDDDEI